MADVWLGHHPRLNHPAAIKIIARRFARSANFREGFAREVRAVAGLDHAGVVAVLDAGVVDGGIEANAEAIAGGALVAGAPWLAMEFAEHGELRRLPRPLSWAILRDVLLQLLDALAHAHARGVIHRDIKPDNVLLRVEHDRLRFMLTDFGIAHVRPDRAEAVEEGRGTSAGTPHYMAPEQLKGQWRDFGPWTDLYALGCVAFELADGKPPYRGRSAMAIAARHIDGEIPVVEPARPMPGGFPAWVRRLMSRERHERFQSAAEAAYALAQLPAPDDRTRRLERLGALARLGVSGGAAPTIVGAAAVAHTLAAGRPAPRTLLADDLALGATLTGVIDVAAIADLVLAPTSTDEPRAEVLRPPVPETWFAPGRDRPLLRGVGLGLFGVRALPMVGRDDARELLWTTLREVERESRCRAILLEGPEGSGKSRIAEWFAHRVQEVGAARVLRLIHSAMSSPGAAMAGALERAMGTWGLTGEALTARVAAALHDPADAVDDGSRCNFLDVSLLSGWLDQRAEDEGRQAAVLSVVDRFAAAGRWLRRLARRSPVVVVLDDVQWGRETLEFVYWMMRRPEQAPIVFVATARPELVAARARIAQIYDRVAAQPEAERFAVGDLGAADHARFVQEILGLSPALEQRLLHRTHGRPLLGLQIVADWVERGVLFPASDGYHCSATGLAEIPPDLETIALRRTQRLAERVGRAETVRIALEVAAVLGHAVFDEEWAMAVAALGKPLPRGLRDALLDAGLGEAVPGGWAFTHSFFVDALQARARRDGRWVEINRACAVAVHLGRVPLERKAKHLLASEAYREASATFLHAIDQWMDSSAYTQAIDLLDLRARALDALNRPPEHPDRVLGLLRRHDCYRFTVQTSGRKQIGAQIESLQIESTRPDLMAGVARARAGNALVEGRLDDMLHAYTDALALYERANDIRGVTRAAHGLGWSNIYRGCFAEAWAPMQRALEAALECGSLLDELWAWHGFGSIALFSETPISIDWLDKALVAGERVGSTIGVASLFVVRSEWLRADGRVGEAIDELSRAVDMLGTVSSSLTGVALANRGYLELDLGRLEDARRTLSEAFAEQLHRVPTQFQASIWAAQAWLAVRERRFDDCVAAIASAEANRPGSFAHPVVRRAYGQIARGLEEAGRWVAAAEVWGIAARCWRPVDPTRADKAMARFDTLVQRTGAVLDRARF